MVTAPEQAKDYDRLWFERHEGDRRVRPYLPGEFKTWDGEDPVPEDFIGWVEVTQIEPGERARRLLTGDAIATATDVDDEDELL